MENNPLRHNGAPDPFQEVNVVLSNAAETSREEYLDATVKQQQRQDLFTMASAMHPSESTSTAVSSSAQTPPQMPKRAWWDYMPIKMAAAVTGVALLLNLSLAIAPLFQKKTAFSLLIVPEAQAASAFQVLPLQDEETRQVNGWEVHSLIPASAEDIQRSLTIEPATQVTVTQEQTGVFRVTPAEKLAPETIYRVSLSAIVRSSNGTETPRAFSWATQTQADFQIIGVTPRHQTTGVPVNTAIEFAFSREDAVDPTPFFAIEPAVAGRFEKHGRAWVFLPAQPLEKKTVYTVILKKGFAAKDGSGALQEDKRLQFQTDGATPPQNRLYVPDRVESLVGETLKLPVPLSSAEASTTIQMTGYALSPEGASALLTKKAKGTDWAYDSSEGDAPFLALQKPVAFQGDVGVVADPNGFSLMLPTQSAAGMYAVKIVSSSYARPTWFFWQVTDLAAQTIADTQQTLVWIMNGSTKQPAANVRVQFEGQTVTTDAHGLARLNTPEIFKKKPADMLAPQAFSIMKAQWSGQTLLIPFQVNAYVPDWQRGLQTRKDAWSYLYADRPVYRQTDTVNVFGIVADRASHAPLTDLSLEMRQSAFFMDDTVDPTEKVFDRVTVNADELGRFTAQMHWGNRLPGSYQLRLKQGNEVLIERTIEVRAIEKPTYTIQIATDRNQVFAGDRVSATVKAAFYDGTPLIGSKIQIKAVQNSDQSLFEKAVTLDANGSANFTFKTGSIICGSTAEYCAKEANIQIEGRPTSGEQAEIMGEASVQVLVGDRLPLTTLLFDKERQQANGTIEIHAVNWKDSSYLGPIVPNQPVTVEVTPNSWVLVPDGQYYDDVSKTWQQRTRSERHIGTVSTQSLRTDANGVARFVVPIPKPIDKTQWTYRVVVRLKDSRNQDAFAMESVGTYAYQDNPSFEKTIFLDREPSSNEPLVPGTPGKTHLRWMDRTELDENTLKRGILFAILKDGIIRYEILPKNEYSFTFDSKTLVNTQVMAIAFTDQGFQTSSVDLYANMKEKTLNVALQPEATSVLPGATSTIAITVRDAANQPVPHATVLVNVVDQALEGIAPFWDETPLTWLYPFSAQGLIFTNSTHLAGKDVFAGGGGGAGEGDYNGGAPLAPRRIFKDSAAFIRVETDEEGKATVSVPLPENITSWRVEVLAVQMDTDDFRAGEAITHVATTKPVFVDTVLAPRLITGDQGSIRMRAIGSVLTANEPVTFFVEAPELGIERTAVTGTAETVKILSFVAKKAGLFPVRIVVQSAHGSDAIERMIEVRDHQIWSDGWKSAELTTDFGGMEINRPETTVSFMSRDRASVLREWQRLAEGSSLRAEFRAAGLVAQKTLRETYQQQENVEGSLSAYQLASNYSDPRQSYGVSELLYGSASLRASADVALSGPELIDAATLETYLWKNADDRSLDRAAHIQAIAGLAGLHQPVLTSLEEMTAWKDRTPEETAWLMRAWVAVGDSQAVSGLIEEWKKYVQVVDGQAWLTVPNTPTDEQAFVTTSFALATEMVRDSLADPFWNTISKGSADDVRAVLTRTQYLTQRTRRLTVGTSELVVAIPNQPETHFTFEQQPVQTMRLTQEEARGFRVKNVSPGLTASWSNRVYGLPERTSSVTVQRQYERDGRVTTDWKAGETIRVRLSVHWEKSVGGVTSCQVVRDFLPGNVQPLTKGSSVPQPVSNGPADALVPVDARSALSPSEIDGPAVTFTLCQPGEILYPVRVVSSGAYTAEAPIVEEQDRPSLRAVGQAQRIHTQE